ncbi:M12 family metallopeptidase [Leptospira adleri]|uniref:Peptidase M12A domain-containing protein n=1 Tax=Leptospira adleri TaxID=2023186 RepID=A0A2M9YSH5_9LEPT|nr:M12 family metallopeptidase [Leptospira adleri]PJZ54450.1 hypothetical protein CH380_05115 [Leptospira adleri]PJZ61302.1 hypothetical protein CH376_13945 [Leptospira adleri]
MRLKNKLILFPIRFIVLLLASCANSVSSYVTEKETIELIAGTLFAFSKNQVVCQPIGSLPTRGNESIFSGPTNLNQELFPLADATPNRISKFGSFSTPTGTISAEYSQLNSGEFIVGGDMVFKNKIDLFSDTRTPRTFAISSPFARLWANKTVPYTLHSSLKETTRITRAIDYYSIHTEIRFVPRTIEIDYVNFQDNQSGCNSNIGKIGGKQDINVGNECGVSAVVHEMGHSLGLLHEHQRPDRDSFISVVWLNVPPSGSGGFVRFEKPAGIETTAPNYDLCSIMHYSSYSTLNLTTLAPLIITKDEKTIPYPTGFSATDIFTIHNLYNGI